MNRHILTQILAMLIAVQSVIAVADVHKFHQSDNQHISIDHTSQAPDGQFESVDGSTGDDTVAIDDCQHCCHCHGVCHPYMSQAQSVLEAIVSSTMTSFYQFSSSSHQASPDNPPPIS